MLGTSTVTWNLPEPILLLGWNLHALLGTSESSGTFTWNPCWEPRNLLEPLIIGTLTWNLGTFRNLYLEPLYLEPRNLGNLTWNLGICRNIYLEPLLGTSEPAGTFTWNPYLEPRSPPEPLLGTLTWNLGTCRNLYLEPLLGTSEPARTWRDDCPRVPQGLVWLGPQSFQLLGNQTKKQKKKNAYLLEVCKPLSPRRPKHIIRKTLNHPPQLVTQLRTLSCSCWQRRRNSNCQQRQLRSHPLSGCHMSMRIFHIPRTDCRPGRCFA